MDSLWKRCGPNKAVELTGKTLAPFARSSPPAFGVRERKQMQSG